jgi:hypothetical protein
MGALGQVVKNLGGAFRGRRGAPVADPNRRAEERVTKRLPVNVLGHALTSTNVTAVGLQVACPEVWIPALRDRWDTGAVPVRIGLPGGDVIDVACSVVYVSDCDDEVLIGLKFNGLADPAASLWQAYLERLDVVI